MYGLIMNKLPNRNTNVEKDLLYMMLLSRIIYILRCNYNTMRSRILLLKIKLMRLLK